MAVQDSTVRPDSTAGPAPADAEPLVPSLFVVGTPIGNREDITLRALRILRSVDLIACEDTRHSPRLLKHFDIHKPLLSLHEHNEASRCQRIVDSILRDGKAVALISDAGMPTISDPGQRVVRACLEAGVSVDVIPGPCAISTGLAGAGIPWDSFTFGGFLPNKSEQRRKVLATSLEVDGCHAHVFYESPYRILKTLTALTELAPDREVCLCRELTKKFQEYRRGLACELLLWYEKRPPKGEMTLVIGPKKYPKWARRPQSEANSEEKP